MTVFVVVCYWIPLRAWPIRSYLLTGSWLTEHGSWPSLRKPRFYLILAAKFIRYRTRQKCDNCLFYTIKYNIMCELLRSNFGSGYCAFTSCNFIISSHHCTIGLKIHLQIYLYNTFLYIKNMKTKKNFVLALSTKCRRFIQHQFTLFLTFHYDSSDILQQILCYSFHSMTCQIHNCFSHIIYV